MTIIEQRLRDELHRVAGQVSPERLRALRAPGQARRPLRARRRRLISVTAAVTAAAVGIAVGLTASMNPGTMTSSSAGAMPRYYLTLQPAGAGLKAVVRASSDGRVTGSIAVPGTRGICSWEVAGAADDSRFVINGTDCMEGGHSTGGHSTGGLFTLAVSAAGRPGELTALPAPGSGFQWGMALSPDGTMLALSQLIASTTSQLVYGSVEIVNLVTGTARTVSLRDAPGYWPGVPLWTDGDLALSVPWWHVASGGLLAYGTTLAGIREFAVSPASATAIPGPVHRFPTPVTVSTGATLLTNGGQDILRESCPASGQDSGTAQVIELSAATGRTLRVLHTQPLPGSGKDPEVDPCWVLSADPTGQHILIQAYSFGRLDNGVFTPLPGLQDGANLSAAWLSARARPDARICLSRPAA